MTLREISLGMKISAMLLMLVLTGCGGASVERDLSVDDKSATPVAGAVIAAALEEIPAPDETQETLTDEILTDENLTDENLTDENLTEENEAPWWATIEFFTGASGDPALGWDRSAMLSRDDLVGRIGEAELAEFDRTGLVFEATADLDADGAPETYRVGVYATAQENSGMFVAAYEAGTLIKLFPHEGRPGFSALAMTADGLRWYRCLDCRVYDLITATTPRPAPGLGVR